MGRADGRKGECGGVGGGDVVGWVGVMTVLGGGEGVVWVVGLGGGNEPFRGAGASVGGGEGDYGDEAGRGRVDEGEGALGEED